MSLNRHVLAFVIAIPKPFRRKFLYLIEGFEQVMCETVITNRCNVRYQIVVILKEADSGIVVGEVIISHGISSVSTANESQSKGS